jgi:hypothetical protein
MHFIKSRSTQGRPTLEHASSMVHPCRIRNFAQPSCESHSIESTTTSLVLNLNSLFNDHIFSYLYIGSTRILRKGRGNPKEESQFLVEPRPSFLLLSLFPNHYEIINPLLIVCVWLVCSSDSELWRLNEFICGRSL